MGWWYSLPGKIVFNLLSPPDQLPQPPRLAAAPDRFSCRAPCPGGLCSKHYGQTQGVRVLFAGSVYSMRTIWSSSSRELFKAQIVGSHPTQVSDRSGVWSKNLYF